MAEKKQGMGDTLFKYGAILLAVLVIIAIAALLLTNNGGSIAIYLAGFLIVGMVVLVIAYFLFARKTEPSAVKLLFETMVTAATVNCPANIRGRRLYTSGDFEHSRVCEGRVVGHALVSQLEGWDYESEKLPDGKVRHKLDEYGRPVVKPWVHEEDELQDFNDNGKVVKHVIHKKGDVKKWRESWFLVKPDGFLGGLIGQPKVFRIPENLHTALHGDVFVNCFSFVPLASMGGVMVPNHHWAQALYRGIVLREIEDVNFYMQLDNIGKATNKAMFSNFELQAAMQAKDQIITPPHD